MNSIPHFYVVDSSLKGEGDAGLIQTLNLTMITIRFSSWIFMSQKLLKLPYQPYIVIAPEKSMLYTTPN